MLAEMFKESGTLNSLSKPAQAIYYRLANEFEKSTEYLFMNQEELVEATGMGNKDQWKDFLLMQEVQNYIKGTMAFLAQISQRKTFASLVSMALSGNQQAAKQVQELSGIMNQQDHNRIIILHSVPRPDTSNKLTEPQGGNENVNEPTTNA